MVFWVGVLVMVVSWGLVSSRGFSFRENGVFGFGMSLRRLDIFLILIYC